MQLVSTFTRLLLEVSSVMTTPTLNSFLVVLTGWVFARRHTVSRCLLAVPRLGPKHHSAYHRVFAAAQWSLDDLGLAIFQIVRTLLPGASVIFLSLDDTLARKRGTKRLYGAGMHHDPLISSRRKAVMNYGHSWVILAVIVPLPFCRKRFFSLPILFRLYLNTKTACQQKRLYFKKTELAVQMLQRLCGRYPGLNFHAVGDTAYGGETVLGELPHNCHLTSRLDLDARLYDAPPPRKAGSNGRPRKRGPRRPSPRQMLQSASERSRKVKLDIYGRRDRVRLCEQVARCHKVPDRELKVVASAALVGGRGIQAFYSTCVNATAEQILVWYAMRWSIEQAFQESKQHLGFEEPQGWTRRAVERTAPTAMVLYSLIVTWFAQHGHRAYRPLVGPWYRGKTQPSFADMLATLRTESIREQVSKHAATPRHSQNLYASLIHAYRQVA